MRLGVWQRTGIVATLLWLAVGTYIFWNKEVKEWSARTSISYNFCTHAAQKRPEPWETFKGLEDCNREMSESYKRLDESNPLQYGFYLAGGLAVLAWLAFGIGYGAYRWVIAGRQTPLSD